MAVVVVHVVVVVMVVVVVVAVVWEEESGGCGDVTLTHHQGHLTRGHLGCLVTLDDYEEFIGLLSDLN